MCSPLAFTNWGGSLPTLMSKPGPSGGRRVTDSQRENGRSTHTLLCSIRSDVYVCVCLVRYYEVKMLTDGMMRVGWATPSFPAGQQLGADEHSYAYDGFLVSSEKLSVVFPPHQTALCCQGRHFLCSLPFPSSSPLPSPPLLFSPPLLSLSPPPFLCFLSSCRHASGTTDQRALEGDGMSRTLWAACWTWTTRPFVCNRIHILGWQSRVLTVYTATSLFV